MNKQGVGSLVEVKAGNLYVARTVGIPPTHVGLGARAKADVVRATWTNGVPQNLFDQRAKSVVKEVQQLKGSCPFVYARNGETGVWSFVSGLDLNLVGYAVVGLFVATWAIALAVWRFGRVEERWSTNLQQP